MHILVTGGAGFIGSHLIRKLHEQKYQIDAIDNHSTNPAVSKRREKEIEHAFPDVEIWDLDIKATKGVLNALAKRKKTTEGQPPVDAIVHLAAPISVEESIRDPLKYSEGIYNGTIYVLEAAKACNVKKIIIASTAAVYGNPNKMPITEPITEHAKLGPLSPYAISKLAAEDHARMLARVDGLETVILRFFNVYGPDQDPSSGYSGVVSKFMQFAKNKKQFVIYGDGTQIRDFVDVDDICTAISLALEKKLSPGHIMNIGSGKGVSINELAQKIAKIADVPYKEDRQPARKGDILNSIASIDRAKRHMDYEPKVSLEEGLKKTWEWYSAQK